MIEEVEGVVVGGLDYPVDYPYGLFTRDGVMVAYNFRFCCDVLAEEWFKKHYPVTYGRGAEMRAYEGAIADCGKHPATL